MEYILCAPSNLVWDEVQYIGRSGNPGTLSNWYDPTEIRWTCRVRWVPKQATVLRRASITITPRPVNITSSYYRIHHQLSFPKRGLSSISPETLPPTNQRAISHIIPPAISHLADSQVSYPVFWNMSRVLPSNGRLIGDGDNNNNNNKTLLSKPARHMYICCG